MISRDELTEILLEAGRRIQKSEHPDRLSLRGSHINGVWADESTENLIYLATKESIQDFNERRISSKTFQERVIMAITAADGAVVMDRFNCFPERNPAVLREVSTTLPFLINRGIKRAEPRVWGRFV